MKDLEKKQKMAPRQCRFGFGDNGLTGSSSIVGIDFSNALSNMDIIEKLMVEFWSQRR